MFLGVAMVPWIERLDIYIEDFFFDPATGEWLVPSGRPMIWYILYRWPKFFLGGLAFCILVTLIGSFYIPKLRRFQTPLLICLLALGLIPGACSLLKHMTDMYCPYQTTLYGGKFLHVGLFESHPLDIVRTKTGECWPAGHASGGFALMGFMVFAARPDWRKRILLSIPGFVLGWTMGMFQMVRGHHFLSHTLATIGIAFIIIWALEAVMDYGRYRKSRIQDT